MVVDTLLLDKPCDVLGATLYMGYRNSTITGHKMVVWYARVFTFKLCCSGASAAVKHLSDRLINLR